MNPYLMPSIESGPKVIETLLKLIPPTKWDEALDPDRFTLREVVAHLADWEPIMRRRIQQAVSTPGSTIEVYDEGQMAIDNGYDRLDPFEQARLFSTERHLTAEYLRSVHRGQLSNMVHHPERGELTTEDLANLLLGHDLYHIEQLSAYLI